MRQLRLDTLSCDAKGCRYHEVYNHLLGRWNEGLLISGAAEPLLEKRLHILLVYVRNLEVILLAGGWPTLLTLLSMPFYVTNPSGGAPFLAVFARGGCGERH